MKKYPAVFIFICIALSILCVVDSGANPGMIPVANFTSPVMPAGVPEGWILEKKAGTPLMKMEKEGNTFFLHLTSQGSSSFGLRKEARIDVKKFPILCWRWKVNKLPMGGDVRKKSKDDQALQVYVAFKEVGFPAVLNTPLIGYIWDNEAPKGWSGRSQQIGGDKLRYIVLRNRTDQTGKWYTERRNLYKDYKKLFGEIKGGEPQGLTTGLQIYINSQRTKSPTDSLIGEMYFSDAPADIALAESAREVTQTQVVKISAVKPPASPKISADKKQQINNCISTNIIFGSDSVAVGDNNNDKLQALVIYLIKNPETKLTIIGHTDNIGTKQHNLALSQRRAASVKNYLVDKFNIDRKRLIAQGAGATQPATDNDTDEGRQNNRRVTINDCL
jgi:outer membrane protein OmpA-like peptidoglycan-associated protein